MYVWFILPLGFDFSSDLNTIAFNYPLFGTALLPKLTNLVCLLNTAKIIRGDIDLCDIVFGKNPPEELNLAALTRYMLKFNLDKGEQSSVWSYRPLRQAQQMYAAKDSHAVFEMRKKFAKIIDE